MAKLIKGELSGVVRDVVFRRTKEFGVVVAEYNSGIYKSKVWTDSQAYSRQRFKHLAALSARFREASNLGFELGKKVLSHPSFIKNNYNVLIDRDDVGFDIDYSRICLSHGVLPELEDLKGEIEGNKLMMSWKYVAKNYALPSKQKVKKGLKGDRNSWDKVVVAMYCPCLAEENLEKCLVMNGIARREDCVAEVEIPARYVGLEVYCYAFVIDDERRSSDSQFVGELSSIAKAKAEKGEKVEKIDGSDELNDEVVFMGVEQREDNVSDGGVKRVFVMKFSIDDEIVEEVLAEPLSDDDFRPRMIDGVKRISRASEMVLRMKRLVKVVNPAFYSELLRKGDDLQFENWGELCQMVENAVEGCEGIEIEWKLE